MLQIFFLCYSQDPLIINRLLRPKDSFCWLELVPPKKQSNELHISQQIYYNKLSPSFCSSIQWKFIFQFCNTPAWVFQISSFPSDSWIQDPSTLVSALTSWSLLHFSWQMGKERAENFMGCFIGQAWECLAYASPPPLFLWPEHNHIIKTRNEV